MPNLFSSTLLISYLWRAPRTCGPSFPHIMTNEVPDTPEFGPIYFNLRHNYTNEAGSLRYYYTLPTISTQSKRATIWEKRPKQSFSSSASHLGIPLPLFTKDHSIAPLFWPRYGSLVSNTLPHFSHTLFPDCGPSFSALCSVVSQIIWSAAEVNFTQVYSVRSTPYGVSGKGFKNIPKLNCRWHSLSGSAYGVLCAVWELWNGLCHVGVHQIQGEWLEEWLACDSYYLIGLAEYCIFSLCFGCL